MKNTLFHIGAVLFLVSVSGCGGSKVLKDPEPLVLTKSLAGASDERLSVTLEWVIVRDGPGTWAKNADWDEYLVKIANRSTHPMQVTELVVVNSLNERIESLPSRRQLVRRSKKTSARYKKLGIKVEAGSGDAKVLPVAGVTAAGAAFGAMSAASAPLVPAAGGAVVVGAVVLAPVLAVGGIVRGVNQSAVNEQIKQRQTVFPIEASAGDELMLDVFFPLAPSPRSVELVYSDATDQHSIVIDTSSVLDGLHMKSRDYEPRTD